MKRKRLLKWSVILSAVLAILISGIALAATVIIDPFDDSQYLQVVRPASSGFSSVAAPSAMGGNRDVVITNATGNTGTTVTVEVNQDGNSLFSISHDVTVSSIAEVQWDGADATTAVDYDGLGGQDLTVDGNDRFVIGVLVDDLAVDTALRVYSGSADACSELELNLPGGIDAENPQSFALLFSDFTTCVGAAGPADFANAGAITLTIFQRTNLDLQFHFIEVTTAAYRDFGDLPASYNNTRLAENGARHTPGDIALGGDAIDVEANGQRSANANGDDNNNLDDEDGVVIPDGENWSDGTGNVVATVTGADTACLSAWVDYSGTAGVFDASDQVMDRVLVVSGANPLSFPLPAGVANNASFYVRFRLITDKNQDGFCTDEPFVDQLGEVFDGEVEDYLWSFGPTAIELTSLRARASAPAAPLILGAATLLLIGLVGVKRLRRKF